MQYYNQQSGASDNTGSWIYLNSMSRVIYQLFWRNFNTADAKVYFEVCVNPTEAIYDNITQVEIQSMATAANPTKAAPSSQIVLPAGCYLRWRFAHGTNSAGDFGIDYVIDKTY